MKRVPKPALPADQLVLPVADSNAIVQIKVWLIGKSPMVWRRVLVPASCTLRELHGVIQVAMGWEGLHLFQFLLRAARYGSLELSASSAEVTMAALRLRKGARFVYEYDLNIPWRHGIRIEDHVAPAAKATYPACSGGQGACPPEDCHDPSGFMAHRDGATSWDELEDLATLTDILRPFALRDEDAGLDDEKQWRLEQALDRTRARERARGVPFAQRTVNDRLRQGAHRELMHQHY